MAFPTAWTKKQKLTIDYTKVGGSSNLTDFTVLLTEAVFQSEIFSYTQGKEINSNYLKNSANLQGYWRFESNWNDGSANGYNLTANNSPTCNTAGKFTNGAAFVRASSQNASIAGASCGNLNITGSQTWACWVKPTANNDCRIMWKNDGSGHIRGLYTTGGGASSRLFFYLSGLTTNEYVDGGVILKTGVWQHIAGVYDSASGKLRVYVNGVLKNEVDATGSSTSNAGIFTIGGESGSYFDGMVDDAVIFNSALTGTEIWNLIVGGCDLRFSSDYAGGTQLAFEVVNWDIINSKAEVYVKVPSVSYTANTIFYVWYGNAAAVPLAENDTYGTQNAWDSNFKAVHHMSAIAFYWEVKDSTSNNNDMDTVGGTTPGFGSNGKYSTGGAVDFTNDGCLYKDHYNHATGNMTATILHKLDSNTTTDGVLSVGRGGSGFAFYPNGSNTCAFSINTTYGPSISDMTATGNWNFLSGTYNGTNARIYQNGGYKAQSAGDAPGNNADCDFIIGALVNNNYYMDGLVEEVRISNIDRGDGWLTTEYNNLNAPTTFTTSATTTVSTVSKIASVSMTVVKKLVAVTNVTVKKVAGVSN